MLLTTDELFTFLRFLNLHYFEKQPTLNEKKNQGRETDVCFFEYKHIENNLFVLLKN